MQEEDDGNSPPSFKRKRADIPSSQIEAEHLTSYQDHADFLLRSLREATESVMISSYSVTPAKLFREGIDRAIVEAASRGVQIYIYYQNLPWLPPEEDRRWQDMIRCCERFEENDNHAKCLIQDKFRVTIGSYNWLSDPKEQENDLLNAR